MRRSAAFLFCSLPIAAHACAGCRPAVFAQVFDAQFLANAAAVFSPLALLAVAALVLPWNRDDA